MAKSKGGKHKAFTRWEESDKRRAVAVYKQTGSIQKTCDLTGISRETIHNWMKKDFWKQYMLQLKSEDTAELEEAATDIAKLSNSAVRDRLTNGDVVLTRDGELVRKPINGRDAAVIMGIALTKRKELQEQPIRENQLGSAERLLKLVEQFAQLANATKVKQLVDQSEIDASPTPSVFGIPEPDEREPIYTEYEEVTNAKLEELQEGLQAGSQK